MTKKMIKTWESVYVPEVLRDLKIYVDEWIETYGEHAILDLDSGYVSLHTSVRFEREETDEEYSERLQNEEEQRKRNLKEEAKEEEKARKLYQQLKKRFGD